MTLARRDFLAWGGGALVVGVALPGCALLPGRRALERELLASGELRPDAWLRITPDDRVIFVLDRVEMGQGTMTSQTQLIAEELEVDPARVEIALAPADRAYDNRAPETPYQNTGGSTSTRYSWEPLRRAGATARELLRQAAAATWGVPLAECVAKDGAVHHPASGRSARYGALVAAAAKQRAGDVALKDPKDFRVIGHPLRRLDARPKVDGSAVFGIDVARPGQQVAVVVRPPTLRGKARRVDAAAARARGAEVVVIDAGVAVVARTTWEARRAAALVEVDWDPGPLATVSTRDIRAAFTALARRGGAVRRDDGDAARELARAARRVEALYEVPYLAHATMEPQNCTALVAGGRCEIWAPTQSPGVARLAAADALGMDLADVTVHQTLLGGGFGRRLPQDYVVEAVQVAARLRGTPVQVVWSREDDTRHDYYRPLVVNALAGGVDAAGRPVAWRQHLVSQSIVGAEAGHAGADVIGAMLPDAAPRPLRHLMQRTAPRAFARDTLPDPSTLEGAVDLAYAIPHVRVEHTVAETGVPVGFWRGVGHSHTGFVVECFLDELAHLGGKDPLALRRALLLREPRRLRVLELAAARAGWGAPLPAGRGRGLAVTHAFHSTCAQVMEVSVEGAGVRVHRVVAAVDCGRVVNPDLVVAQVESAVIFGLSAALRQEITIEDGRVLEGNFHHFGLLRMHETPAIEVHLVPSEEPPTGIGEPGLPPVAPALCNAIFAASGRRIRRLPVEAALAEAT